jgi:hypothetical protein
LHVSLFILLKSSMELKALAWGCVATTIFPIVNLEDDVWFWSHCRIFCQRGDLSALFFDPFISGFHQNMFKISILIFQFPQLWSYFSHFFQYIVEKILKLVSMPSE